MMIASRHSRPLAGLVTAACMLACSTEVTSPETREAAAGPVYTSLSIQGPGRSLALIGWLHTGWLEIRAEDQYGRAIVTDRGSFSVTSDNPGVVSVDDPQFWTSSTNGVQDGSWIRSDVRAVAPGEANVSVSWTIGRITRTARTTIRVESTDGWSLKLEPAALTVKLGLTQLVQARIVDAAGRIRLQPYGVSFTPARAEMVTLSYDDACFDWYPCPGVMIRGEAVGETTVSATVEGLAAAIRVTVVP